MLNIKHMRMLEINGIGYLVMMCNFIGVLEICSVD